MDNSILESVKWDLENNYVGVSNFLVRRCCIKSCPRCRLKSICNLNNYEDRSLWESRLNSAFLMLLYFGLDLFEETSS